MPVSGNWGPFPDWAQDWKNPRIKEPSSERGPLVYLVHYAICQFYEVKIFEKINDVKVWTDYIYTAYRLQNGWHRNFVEHSPTESIYLCIYDKTEESSEVNWLLLYKQKRVGDRKFNFSFSQQSTSTMQSEWPRIILMMHTVYLWKC